MKNNPLYFQALLSLIPARAGVILPLTLYCLLFISYPRTGGGDPS
ncbi:hypothetical protein SAMN02910447_03510, partial [Ruminococcus sp. YE71]